MEGDAARFVERMATRFPFLHPDKIMDGGKRRPGHVDYDPRTLHVPSDFFRTAKVTEGQQQWWDMKAKNFDSVMLFKIGKFYEVSETRNVCHHHKFHRFMQRLADIARKAVANPFVGPVFGTPFQKR